MTKPASRLLLSVTLLASFCPYAFAQKLSAEEQKVVLYVDTHQEEAIAFLGQIVDIESPTQNVVGVKQAGIVLKNELESLGLTARWIDMPVEMKHAGHLLAETTGAKGKRLLLMGTLSQMTWLREDGITSTDNAVKCPILNRLWRRGWDSNPT